jgi:hypothetical protein
LDRHGVTARLFLERLRNAPQNVKSFIEEKKEHIDESCLAMWDYTLNFPTLW